ncbi:hypothetical protein [Aurantimonas coralicida]|uniref:hypothetical protein n=1 Tax=Aurantimonas coralicida TaxID=182270 RepID=UPI001D19024B|nr:hypothetical protein [Aurantimonas coralicida]MCC4296269.1 hypothetical protein [Aurantimonas coralicida]
MLKKVVEQFDEWTLLPVDISDIRDAILEMGLQEKIVFSAQPIDSKELRGAYYRFKARDGVYGNVERVSLIVYSQRQELYWQRVVCCKEAMHIFDSVASSTNTPEELVALAEQLMGPVTTEAHGLAEVMAATDRLALYQAICILFPDAARDVAREAIATGTKTVEQVSDWAQLPIDLARLVLSDQWPEIREIILDC